MRITRKPGNKKALNDWTFSDPGQFGEPALQRSSMHRSHIKSTCWPHLEIAPTLDFSTIQNVITISSCTCMDAGNATSQVEDFLTSVEKILATKLPASPAHRAKKQKDPLRVFQMLDEFGGESGLISSPWP